VKRDSLHDRAFRALLRLLPAEFRSAHARDMEATFRADRRDHGGGPALWRLWAATTIDLLRTAPAAHLDLLGRDLRLASRGLRRRPLHALAAIASLALGLGASVAVFAVVDAVLLSPLPWSEPERLVEVREQSAGGESSRLGHATVEDLRRRSRAFTRLVAASQSSATLAGDAKREAMRVGVMRVSAGYFEMLGAAPFVGRTFDAADDRPGAARRVVVLGHRLWRERFDGDPAVVGRALDLGNGTYTVIGVMGPRNRDLLAERVFGDAQMWTPLGYDPAASYACRTCRHLAVYGQLAPGLDPEAAQRDASAVLAALAREHPTQYNEPRAAVWPLAEQFFGPVRPVLLALVAGALLLLLVACGSVGNLLLLRAGERAHEIAVRAALGVTRGQLARQLVTEALLLSALAGVVGLGLAQLAVRAVVAAADLPRLDAAGLDARAVVAALGLVFATGLLFGLVPLRQLWRRDVAAALAGAGRRSDDRVAWRTRAGLVAANVGLATALLVGAGLLVRSLGALLAVAPGFEPAGLTTAQVVLSGPAYQADDNADEIALASGFYERALERLRAWPGVTAAAAVTTLPLGGGLDAYGLHVTGIVHDNPEEAPSADRFVVTPGFFETMRIPVLRGRALDRRDGLGAPPVAVVNRRIATELLAGRDPLGLELRLGPADAQARTIVGVVGDVQHGGLDEAPGYQVYVPQAQWVWAEGGLSLVVRTSGEAGDAGDAIRSVVRELDPRQPVSALRPYPDLVAERLGPRRLAAGLLLAFAATALLLAMVGLYGALGVMVERRSRELSLRVALGARGGQIAALVLGQGLRPVFSGLCAGLAIAAVGSGVLQALLFGLAPTDPLTFAGAAGLLLACALPCCLMSARRALQLDPTNALRSE
jgi:putative ABC transport system permease protein